MIYLPIILEEFCEENDYFLLTETPNGSNIVLDKFLSSGKHYALFYNIIEEGNVGTADSGRIITMQRNVEISLLTKDIKEDEGKNYLPIIQDLIARQMALFRYLLMRVDNILSCTYSSGVDTNDACLAVCRLNLSFEDNYTTNC